MRSHHRSTLASFALKTLTGAIASAVFVTSAYAAGLGKLTVHSALGQPLNAEIELTSVSNDEASGLVAKLASPDAFRLANIEFNPALSSLRFAVEQRGSRQFIKITSSQPLNEPFVDMLLELNWSSGRLVREYTFLLDPAEMRTTQSAQVAPSEGRANPAAPTQARPAPRPSAQPAPAPREAERTAREAVSEYKVKSGDTLGRIAREVKPVEISLDMMLVALYRANPDAFSGNNMNRLKSGTILAVPDSEAIKGSTSSGEARGVVVAHAADFNAYRNKLAGQVATAAPDRERAANQRAAGKISAQVKERPTAANESQDQLRLSKAASDNAAAAGAALSAEEKIAKDRALADATARVKELERNVNDLESLMAVKSKSASDAAKPAVEPTPAAAPAVAPAAPVAVAPAVAPVVAPAVPPTVAPVNKPATLEPEAAAEPTMADMVMDNITTVALGLGALLLGLAGITALRRRKAAAGTSAAASEPSILGAPTDQAHSLFAHTGGQSVDTNNSVFNSSFAPSASQLDTNEVDPVAEADVYIAYGRDAQAEEILKEALRTHPERLPVRMKLLEIYAARKDLRAFETQATEVYSITRGHGDDWAQAAMLGLAIDAANPLYASAANAMAATHTPSAEELAHQVMLSNQMDDPLTSTPAASDFSASDLDLDLSHDASALAQPDYQAAQAAHAPAATPLNDDHTLDFDLGGLSFEPVSPAHTDAVNEARGAQDPILDFSAPDTITPLPAPTPVLAGTADDAAFDIPFDMSFDAPAPAQPAPQLTALDTASLDLAKHDPDTDFGTVDLSREFDQYQEPGLPLLPETPAASTAGEAVHHPLMDLDAMDFDQPSAAPVAAPAAAPELSRAAALSDDDYFNLDLPGAAAPEQTTTPAAPQFDISSIDLELPQAEHAAFDNTPTALPELGTQDHFGDSLDLNSADEAGAQPDELSAVQMEMETKLDLAIAYQEIGDKEGARELLDEVIKGGSAEQVERANDMRTRLA